MRKRSRRRLSSGALVACLAGTLVIGGSPAHATPDGVHILISNAEEAEHLVDLVFPASVGWVFGDRIGYQCAYLYFDEGGVHVAKITIEAIGGYEAKINDMYGVEQHPQTQCGTRDTSNVPGGTPLPLAINATTFTLGGLLSDATWAAGGCSDGSPTNYLVYDGAPWVKVTLESLGAAVGPCPLASIESFSPRRGTFGTTVVLSGANFAGATRVAFDGKVAPDFSVDSPTQITATLPHGATSGPVSVATADGVVSGAGRFTVTHRATLALRLRSSSRGRVVASGSVRIPDGTGACRGGRRVILENKVGGGWRHLGAVVTHPDGSFSDDLGSIRGWVRARLIQGHVPAGDVCDPAQDSSHIQRS